MPVRSSIRIVALVFAALVCGCLFSFSRGAEGQVKDKAESSWAYRTPTHPKLPVVRNRDWVRNPIDAFILAKIEEAGLTPAPEADRSTLVRRLFFDLIGLPPTPEETEAFVQDPSPDAYESLVDRLLASPRHGERWALHWLDLVRYAESDGFKADDVRPTAWRYRDYVIGSFNADKPYDRFIREQLAGDELYPNDEAALVATGFNRHYPEETNAVNLEQRRQEVLNDMTDTTSQVFLGLTVGCARCHDHKFDPILHTDYYRIQAFFASYYPADVPIGDQKELQHYREQTQEWEAKTADLRKRMAEIEEPYRRQFLAQRMRRFPREYQEAYETDSQKRTPLQQQLAKMVAKQVEVQKTEVTKAMKAEQRGEWDQLNKQMGQFTRLKPPQPPTTMTLTDIGPVAPTTYLLKRGNWRQRGQEVPPGFLSAIDDRAAEIAPPGPGSRTTGRRAVLADWLARPENPLTTRVMVNRLWQHHFGRGIVATPSDFGVQGTPPSHPELLDWLACEFVARGWSLKAVHRLIVTSGTYRQANAPNKKSAEVDPENALFGRMNRRRLEGEALRDAMLAVSGQLNLAMGGPSVHPELPAELGVPRGGWPVSKDLAERNRRSVYVFVKRNLRYPMFSAFDAPDSNETCARRHQSTNAPQALMLLNSAIVHDLARAFAMRVVQEAGDQPTQVVDRAYRLALGRSPDAQERELMVSYLAACVSRSPGTAAGLNATPAPSERETQAAVAGLCHALLNLNEFLYVD
jgi:hypothetical protein